MTTYEAKRLCPQIILVIGNNRKCAEMCRHLEEICLRFAPRSRDLHKPLTLVARQDARHKGSLTNAEKAPRRDSSPRVFGGHKTAKWRKRLRRFMTLFPVSVT